MIDCEELLFKEPSFQIPRNFSSFEGQFGEEKERLESVLDLGSELCHLHDNEARHLVCLECRQVACVRCLLDAHRAHLWSDLEEVRVRIRKVAGLDEISVSGFLAQGLERKTELSVEKAEFLREVDSSERAILKAGQDVKDLVDRHTDALVAELDRMKMRKLADIESARLEVEKELKILELFHRNIARKFTKDEEEEGFAITDTKHAFVSKPSNGDIETTLTSPRSSYCRSAAIAFQEADIIEQLTANNSNLLGRLKAEFDLRERREGEQGEACFRNSARLIDFPDEAVGFKSSTIETEECHVTVQLTAILDTAGRNVFGVAAMLDNVYVLLSNSILVFAAKGPFERNDEIKAPQFMYPFDLAACPLGPCLYVTDDGHGCLWRVDGRGEQHRRVTRFLDGIGEPCTVSVNPRSGHVTLLRSGQPSTLQEFDGDGESVRVVVLPDDVIEPQHAVVTSSGETVLCCRTKGRSNNTWAVCLLTVDGAVSVRCELRDAVHHLAASPCHLAVDERDRVLVADWQRKVDLFDADLNWDRTLVSRQRDGIERPERIWYDRVSRLLLVVHGWGKKTHVYRYVTKDISQHKRDG